MLTHNIYVFNPILLANVFTADLRKSNPTLRMGKNEQKTLELMITLRLP